MKLIWHGRNTRTPRDINECRTLKHRLWPITDTSHIKGCELYKFQTDNSIAFAYWDSGLNLTRSFNKCRVLFVLVKVRVPLCTCEVDMIWLHEYVMWSLRANEEFMEGWVGSIELLEDHPKEIIIMIIITVITWKKKNGSSFPGSLHSTPT